MYVYVAVMHICVHMYELCTYTTLPCICMHMCTAMVYMCVYKYV